MLQSHIDSNNTYEPSISLISSIADARNVAKFDGRQGQPTPLPIICGCRINEDQNRDPE